MFSSLFNKVRLFPCTKLVRNIILHVCAPFEVPYSLDQSPLLISHHSRIEAAPPDPRKEIVAALK